MGLFIVQLLGIFQRVGSKRKVWIDTQCLGKLVDCVSRLFLNDKHSSQDIMCSKISGVIVNCIPQIDGFVRGQNVITFPGSNSRTRFLMLTDKYFFSSAGVPVNAGNVP